ncbi:MAG: enoyl-CoA hydratase/isomerase family protein [Acidimicrobiia bacterium]
MTELVLVEDRGPVRVLTLNRPEKLNALSAALVEGFSVELAEAAGREATRVVILAGAGRSFCAGYDLSEEADPSIDPAEGLRHSLGRLLEVFDHPKPIIAQVQGHCLAGGCDLMMMCDLAVASEDAVFGQPEIRFGAAVVAHVMPWLIGARRAKELVLTGEDKVSASEAERIGLVNRVVPGERLEEETMLLADALAMVDPYAMQMTKRAINLTWEAAGFRDALLGGVELGAMIENARVPEREEFERITAEQGLGEAIRWRDERFEK